MKNSALITILATAAVASAQVSLDNGTYTCSKPNVAFCAGDSMKTDIIVRCDSTGRGQPGRCSDNLAGEPPVGVRPALCYETNPTIGDAACEKNCIVYGGSGNGAGDFTLPASLCTPEFSTSGTATGTVTDTATGTATGTGGGGIATTTTTNTATDCGKCETSTFQPPPPPPATIPTGTTETLTEETTICPTTSTGESPSSPPPVDVTTSPPVVPTTAPVVSTTAPVYPTGGNGTVITSVSSPVKPSTGPPIVPTTTGPSTISSAGAAVNVAGGLLAGMGMAVAYIL